MGCWCWLSFVLPPDFWEKGIFHINASILHSFLLPEILLTFGRVKEAFLGLQPVLLLSLGFPNKGKVVGANYLSGEGTCLPLHFPAAESMGN